LNERTLNNDLLRHLARLQGDPEPGIRANTTVCLGMIAKHLTADTKKKILTQAFGRSLRDPFPPSRISTLQAILATADQYDAEDLSCKLMPVICMSLIDPEKPVRVLALKCMQLLMKKVETFANAMPETQLAEANKSPTQSSSGQAAASESASSEGWTGWAMGAITKTIYTTSGSTGSSPTKQANNQPAPSANVLSTKPVSGPPSIPPSASAIVPVAGGPVITSTSTPAAVSSGGWDDGGWEDMDKVFNSGSTGMKLAPVKKVDKLTHDLMQMDVKAITPTMSGDGWQEFDDWNSTTSPTKAPQATDDVQRKKEERKARIEQLKQQRRAQRDSE